MGLKGTYSPSKMQSSLTQDTHLVQSHVLPTLITFWLQECFLECVWMEINERYGSFIGSVRAIIEAILYSSIISEPGV